MRLVIARTWMALGTSVRALVVDLRDPDMGRLGVGAAAVSFATWCFTIALGVYGFDAHGAAGVGIVALVRYLPAALVSPLVGLLILIAIAVVAVLWWRRIRRARRRRQLG